MPTGQALPFLAYSEGTLTGTPAGWTSFNANAVILPVTAKKGYFSTPANSLPNNGNPYGSVWKQDLGQISYFTPGITLNAAVSASLQFTRGFVPQTIKLVLCNSADSTRVTIVDSTTVTADGNGGFAPIVAGTISTTLLLGTSYWVEVEFSTTIKAVGFLTKYWWAINEIPITVGPTGGTIFDSTEDYIGTH